MQLRSSLLIVMVLTGAAPSPTLAQPAADRPDVDEIVVTGQKIERTLQDTKESVAVVTEEAADDLVLLQLEDVFDATANAFSFNGGESFGLRGVSQNAASTGGGNGELGQLYLDGVAYTGFSNRFGPKDLWDVSRVEILRGPQSTNVGRNALIGAVAVTTNRPSFEREAAVRLQAGTFDTRSAEGMVNLPLGDRMALRLTAESFRSDGYVENVTRGEDDYDGREADTFRAKLLLTPTDRLTALLTLQHAETERGQDLYRADLTGLESRVASANLTAFDRYEAATASLDVEYALTDRLSLRSVSAYIEGNYARFDDDDNGPEGGNAFRGRTAEDTNWSEELRLTYDGERVSGVVGAFVTEIGLVNDTSGLVNIALANFGVPGSLLPFYPDVLEVENFRAFDQDTFNAAFFTEWDLRATDRLTLSAGLRYDYEEIEASGGVANALAPGSALPDPSVAGAQADAISPGLGPIVEGGVTQVNAGLRAQLVDASFPERSRDFDAFLPQAGVSYEVSDALTLSAFYKRGYRAGGFDITSSGTVDLFEPEYLDNAEVALRFVGDAFRVQANAYYGWWTDQQVRVFEEGNIFDFDVQNVGESTIAGFEIEGQAEVTDNTVIYASLGYAYTEFDAFCSANEGANPDTCDGPAVGDDLSGNDFAFSPDWSGSFGGRHDFGSGFYASGSASYAGGYFSDVENREAFENDGAVIVNARAGWQRDGFDLSVYATNLLDEFQTQFRGPGIASADDLIVRANATREVGVLVAKRF